MAGRRALTSQEERAVIRVARHLHSRDRALITTLWSTGFRINEVKALRVGHVLRDDDIAEKIGVAPRHLKGHYGKTRWVPVVPELHRALRHHLWWLRLKYEVTPDLPLFPSRQRDRDGNVRPLARSQLRDVVKAVLRQAGVVDDGRLGTHTLRKTFARNVYKNSGRDIMLLKRALNHSNVATTQKYLEVEEDAVEAAIRKCDFTRAPRQKVRIANCPFAAAAGGR